MIVLGIFVIVMGIRYGLELTEDISIYLDPIMIAYLIILIVQIKFVSIGLIGLNLLLT